MIGKQKRSGTALVGNGNLSTGSGILAETPYHFENPFEQEHKRVLVDVAGRQHGMP